MELNSILSNSTWGKAASDINTNFTTISVDLEKVKNATTKNKGYFKNDTLLKQTYKTATVGDIAYVGTTYPYQIWEWNGSTWADSGATGGSESVNLNDYTTKEELAELGSKVMERTVLAWDDIPDNKGAITYAEGLDFNLGVHKAIAVKEGDIVYIKASKNGAYASIVTRIPIDKNISYIEGGERITISANGQENITIPSGANWILIENGRNNADTKPISVSINGFDLFKGVLNDYLEKSFGKMANWGIFTINYNYKVNITKEKIVIPQYSRISYNSNLYYQNTSEITLARGTSNIAEFVLFDIEKKEYKLLTYGEFDISDKNLILCFYVLYSTFGCSLNPQLYTLDGELVLFPGYNMGTVIPPNELKLIIEDNTITIPALSRIYYNGVVYRLGAENVVVDRLASYDSGWSEELLVFNSKTKEFKCIGGGNYSSEYVKEMIILCGLKKGSNGTTLSPQITSTNYISELCVAFGKKVNITDSTVTIPSNSRVYYNHNSYYQIDSDLIFDRESGAQQQFIMFDCVSKELYITGAGGWPKRNISAYPLFWVNYTNGCSLPTGLYTINGKPIYETSDKKLEILDFNPRNIIEPKIIPQTRNKDLTTLTLVHFSDLHGYTTNLARIVEFTNTYKEYINDIIHTGDSVNGIISDTNPFESVEGAERILNVIGNHEAWLSYDIPDYTATEKQCYDKIFAPSIANWGVVQPADAEALGKCYYYKDYLEAKIRLIVLDNIHWHTRFEVADDASAQKTWFINTLEEARSKEYTVIAAMHYTPVNGVDLIKNTGFSRYSKNDTEIWGDGWYASDEIFNCVDEFVENGGQFATWLIGHTHYDMCGQVHGHNRQFMIVIQSCSRSSVCDYMVNGTKTQDAFNVLTIEPTNGLVKITRIGNDTDAYMQSKKTLCYDFKNKELIYST